jgi:hypothetical protein
MSNQENTKNGGLNLFSSLGFNRSVQIPAELESKPYLNNTILNNQLKVSIGGQYVGLIASPYLNYPYPAGIAYYIANSGKKSLTLTLEGNNNHSAEIRGDADVIAKIASILDNCDVNKQHEPRSSIPLSFNEEIEKHILCSKDGKENYCGAGVIFINENIIYLGQSLYGYQDFGRIYDKDIDNKEGNGDINTILKNIAVSEVNKYVNLGAELELNDLKDEKFIELEGQVENGNNKKCKYRYFIVDKVVNNLKNNEKYLNINSFNKAKVTDKTNISRHAKSLLDTNNNQQLIAPRTAKIINSL